EEAIFQAVEELVVLDAGVEKLLIASRKAFAYIREDPAIFVIDHPCGGLLKKPVPVEDLRHEPTANPELRHVSARMDCAGFCPPVAQVEVAVQNVVDHLDWRIAFPWKIQV